jgi:hypothetical protein
MKIGEASAIDDPPAACPAKTIGPPASPAVIRKGGVEIFVG